MAKAKKLKSGSWRCLVYDYTSQDKKRHYKSFTADTKKEAEYMAAEYAMSKKQKSLNVNDSITFKAALEEYCKAKSNLLSPSTIKGYHTLRNSAYADIENLKLKDLTKQVLQRWINNYSEDRSPKTISNAYGLLTAVLRYFIDSFDIKVTLPQKIKYDAYVPNDAEIEILMNYYKDKDKDMLIASCLAAFGTLRRSEICGLHTSNVKGCTVRIRQSMVMNSDRKYVIKDFAKNYSSSRDVVMPKFVIDMFPTEGMVVKINPTQLTLRHVKALKRLGINKFRFHDLRHYSASIMHALGVPDQYIMQRGGWSSDRVLKDIYRGTIDDYSKAFEKTVLNHYEELKI